ncbi:hypothetical protein GA0070558_116108 [Micromonospora haikouensis]|uniref:Uncharacterized protein n=1 Tax=Micromonospora haikouensis TaxID=686309 RepID=A0A1C4WLA1_9ACTN|nr:hypothetical protein GA0070558_116108 [Micromonospora haikouensis]
MTFVVAGAGGVAVAVAALCTAVRRAGPAAGHPIG